MPSGKPYTPHIHADGQSIIQSLSDRADEAAARAYKHETLAQELCRALEDAVQALDEAGWQAAASCAHRAVIRYQEEARNA